MSWRRWERTSKCRTTCSWGNVLVRPDRHQAGRRRQDRREFRKGLDGRTVRRGPGSLEIAILRGKATLRTGVARSRRRRRGRRSQGGNLRQRALDRAGPRRGRMPAECRGDHASARRSQPCQKRRGRIRRHSAAGRGSGRGGPDRRQQPTSRSRVRDAARSCERRTDIPARAEARVLGQETRRVRDIGSRLLGPPVPRRSQEPDFGKVRSTTGAGNARRAVRTPAPGVRSSP